MHNFVVHSNESACRKRGSFGLEQVIVEGISTVNFSFLELKGPEGIGIEWDLKDKSGTGRFSSSFLGVGRYLSNTVEG